jgi:hypothetical protein
MTKQSTSCLYFVIFSPICMTIRCRKVCVGEFDFQIRPLIYLSLRAVQSQTNTNRKPPFWMIFSISFKSRTMSEAYLFSEVTTATGNSILHVLEFMRSLCQYRTRPNWLTYCAILAQKCWFTAFSPLPLISVEKRISGLPNIVPIRP